MKKICTVLGARPQFIKANMVSRKIQRSSSLKEIIIHTGQHYDYNLSECFFEELAIPEPQYHLNIGSGTHGGQTGQMLIAIEAVLLQEKPDLTLVYGDTNSTLAGALAASKLHIPLAHIEAGLRSFNRRMPEEINRIVADHTSKMLFPPNQFAYDQLLKEGLPFDWIHLVGDVMYDAVLFYQSKPTQKAGLLENLKINVKTYALVTLHRAENTDDSMRLQHISQALEALSEEITIVFPIHPRTLKALQTFGFFDLLKKPQIKLIDPVGYFDMLALEQHAKLIITDSGGVQKEAYFNQVPCVTLRDETEWMELVNSGWNSLCSPRSPFSLNQYLKKPLLPFQTAFFGEGNAAEKIVNVLEQ